MGDGIPFFDIILFAVIAGFVIMRLHSVLGKRTGHEKPPHDPFSQQKKDPFASREDDTANREAANSDNVIALPDRASAGPDVEDDSDMPPANTLAGGLMRVRMLDPNFDELEFLHGAKMAHEMVINAYATGDFDTLSGLLGRTLYGDFARAIEEREEAGETMMTKLVTIRSADIIEAQTQNEMISLTVEFVSEQVKELRDADGNLIDGNPDKIEVETDIWTFQRDARSSDPNWELVGTRVRED